MFLQPHTHSHDHAVEPQSRDRMPYMDTETMCIHLQDHWTELAMVRWGVAMRGACEQRAGTGWAEPKILGTPRAAHVRSAVNHCVDHCLAASARSSFTTS
jgi:hypothetical protein